MKIQNDKVDGIFDQQNISRADNEQQNLERQSPGLSPQSLNDWHHSAERWQRLEQMLDVQTSPQSPPRFGRGRNKKLIAGGTLAGLIFVFCCQAGIDCYLRPQNLLFTQPAFMAVQDAVLRMTLKAEKSMITGIVDADTRTASFYWTIDLKNTSGADQEATAELKLPPGAVVSRATLWVNGEPQEAAFNATGLVTAAYNWVTVSHRDPLLVTYKDASTVTIKAAPVPANGDLMRIRLGITAPLNMGTDGQSIVTVPQLKEANFTIADKNSIHIESKRGMEINTKVLSQEQSATGKHLITGDLPTSDLSRMVIVSPPSDGADNFAVRATHSLPGTYIFSSSTKDSDSEFAALERKKCQPEGKIVSSEAAAHRVSTLWAAREINRLLAQGKTAEAQDLAMIYRVVSPVSGAVVLEMNSDYTRMNLTRDQYMVSVPGQKPIASKYPQPISPEFPAGANGAPLLMGATNGTIQPSMLVQGVNTAGTVRVNNLANLEALFDILFSAGNFGCFVAALYFAQRAVRKTYSSGFKTGLTDVLLAVSLVVCGTTWTLLLPFIAGYKIARFAGKKLATMHGSHNKLKPLEVVN